MVAKLSLSQSKQRDGKGAQADRLPPLLSQGTGPEVKQTEFDPAQTYDAMLQSHLQRQNNFSEKFII